MRRYFNKFNIGWIIWNNNTLNTDIFKSKYDKLLNECMKLTTVSSIEFKQLLTQFELKTEVIKDAGHSYEYIFLNKRECGYPIEMYTDNSFKYFINDMVVYNLSDIVFISSPQAKQSYKECINLSHEKLLRDILKVAPNLKLTINNLVFITTI